MIIRVCLAVLAATSLAACGDNAAQPASAPAAPSAAAPATIDAIVLDGGGLKFAGSLMAFDTPADAVVAAAKAALGADPVMTPNPDCPTGATEDYAFGNQLQIITRDGSFIGWHSSAAGPKTSSGVQTGGAKTADVHEEESQFEQQAISVDGVNGFLNADKQTIGVLYAGDTCIAG